MMKEVIADINTTDQEAILSKMKEENILPYWIMTTPFENSLKSKEVVYMAIMDQNPKV